MELPTSVVANHVVKNINISSEKQQFLGPL